MRSGKCFRLNRLHRWALADASRVAGGRNWWCFGAISVRRFPQTGLEFTVSSAIL